MPRLDVSEGADVYLPITHRSRGGQSGFVSTDAGNIGAPINRLSKLPVNA